jgi:two-component system phosphate regulon sensor histidine kinase PhoR
LETLIDQEISNPEQTRSAMAQMYSQTTRIKGIVEDMLTLANLERGEKPRSEWVDIGDLIAQVRLEAQALSGEKDHEISVEEQYRCAINWNPQELHSLISNLVINAVKYTPASGVIKLRWAITTEGGCFSVQDTGIGIERSHLSRLTERFYRVDVARSRESGGTGLGLAIVKHVLGRMGGELSITSEPEQGSCFTCTFPSELVRQIPQ